MDKIYYEVLMMPEKMVLGTFSDSDMALLFMESLLGKYYNEKDFSLMINRKESS